MIENYEDDPESAWARGIALEQAVQSMTSTDAYGVSLSLKPHEVIETAKIYAEWIITGKTRAEMYRETEDMHKILKGVISGGD